MNMEMKREMTESNIKNLEQIAIPLGIDQTLYIDADKTDVLEAVVQTQLVSELGIDMDGTDAQKLVHVVTNALCQLAQEDAAFADHIDDLLKQPPVH